jgi:hypothetical protein
MEGFIQLIRNCVNTSWGQAYTAHEPFLALSVALFQVYATPLTFRWDWFANSEFCNGHDAYSNLLIQTVGKLKQQTIQRTHLRIISARSNMFTYSCGPLMCTHHMPAHKLLAEYVEFQVPTAVVINNYILWAITLCTQLKVNRRFGGTCLHISACLLLVFAWRVLQRWRWRRHVPPKQRLVFNGLHDVMSLKRELFSCRIIYLPLLLLLGRLRTNLIIPKLYH